MYGDRNPLQQLEVIRAEARNVICMANDVEQYGRRNNIRIRGLKLRHGEECQTAVAMFLNDNLQVVMSCMRVCRKQALSRVKYYYYATISKIQQQQ